MDGPRQRYRCPCTDRAINGDHKKKQSDMSVSEYKELWERMKDNIEPGTDKEDYR